MKYYEFKFPKKLNLIEEGVYSSATSKTGYLVIDYPDVDNDIYVLTGELYGLYYGKTQYCRRTREDYHDLVRMIDEIL